MRTSQAHPHFKDLLFHTDSALADILGAGIRERQTIHEWPLSMVQKLTLDDGTRWVYKSQLPPTVEPAFYQAAASPLLPSARRLGKLGNCDIMIFEWIDAPLLRDSIGDTDALVRHGKRVIAEIGSIQGDLPCYLNIGSVEAWSAACGVLFTKLQTLRSDRRFILFDEDTVAQVRRWTQQPAVVAAAAERSRLIHGDLTVDQVFVTNDGYRVIDWQRPVVAPPEVDLAALLIRADIDPRPLVDPVAIGIFWFLHLHWSVTAQHDIAGAERWPMLDQWAADAAAHILA